MTESGISSGDCSAGDDRKLTTEFAQVANLYVADGHHRSAAAHASERQWPTRIRIIAETRSKLLPRSPLPHNQLRIMDYNRVVKI